MGAQTRFPAAHDKAVRQTIQPESCMTSAIGGDRREPLVRTINVRPHVNGTDANPMNLAFLRQRFGLFGHAEAAAQVNPEWRAGRQPRTGSGTAGRLSES